MGGNRNATRSETQKGREGREENAGPIAARALGVFGQTHRSSDTRVDIIDFRPCTQRFARTEGADIASLSLVNA